MAKLNRPMIKIHNLETDEVIDREMNDDELAQLEIDIAFTKARQAEVEAKQAEKQSILDRIGLTADELQTILG
jgi:hypothetical protein